MTTTRPRSQRELAVLIAVFGAFLIAVPPLADLFTWIDGVPSKPLFGQVWMEGAGIWFLACAAWTNWNEL